jgi:hypothetical protein
VPSVFCFLRQQHSEAAQFALRCQRVSIMEYYCNRGARFCFPSTPTLLSLSACYTRDGAKIGRLTLVSLFWLPLQRCRIYFAGAGQSVLALLQRCRVGCVSKSITLTLGNPFWAPLTAPASSIRQRQTILFWLPPPRQRPRHASAIEAYSGSLLNASVSHTPAQ